MILFMVVIRHGDAIHRIDVAPRGIDRDQRMSAGRPDADDAASGGFSRHRRSPFPAAFALIAVPPGRTHVDSPRQRSTEIGRTCR
ncbi:hypothetical protein [Burkholderia sp. Bp9143]|uniref:hypothetical protein n=1 Tax=Burkholderia sp. Bp9143 TaxID=2184574 RepID=UPI000F5AD675|nr:hypothetical protein [Burkholderia sp. Bp9143]